MATLNETPSSNRLHIGILGKTNSGKSSFVNEFTGENVSIVADVAGTTTDPVYKPMEIHPLGPCVIIDTAGFDDETELGERRMEKTRLAAEKSDIAVIMIAAGDYLQVSRKILGDSLEHGGSLGYTLENASYNVFSKVFPEEDTWYRIFKEKKTPILFVVSKADEHPFEAEKLKVFLEKTTKEEVLICQNMIEKNIQQMEADIPVENLHLVNEKIDNGISSVKSALTRLIPENYGEEFITGNLVSKEDLVLLVMPQDIQAPKGRLILPQVQTLRELLDKKCVVMSVTTDQMVPAIQILKQPPKLIITDSQVFKFVYENKPAESMLTSFSVLFAAYKGDLPYYVEGAKAIDSLTADSKVLIAECCTHAPLTEDIGRVKIPAMLRKRVGESLAVDLVSGTDFPEDLSQYDLIIQCGACMFNRKYVLSRIDRARVQEIPMTNYGVTIAHVTGILDQVTMP